jgi:high-affinity K+ transport system ATPase subunit B
LLALIREEQSLGRMVAITGDGTNDATCFSPRPTSASP